MKEKGCPPPRGSRQLDSEPTMLIVPIAQQVGEAHLSQPQVNFPRVLCPHLGIPPSQKEEKKKKEQFVCVLCFLGVIALELCRRVVPWALQCL